MQEIETIESLRALQDIDNDILNLEREYKANFEKISKLKEILSGMEGEINDKREKLAEAEKWYQEKERELKDDMESVKKKQSRLNALTKNKEYVAIQKEIESLKKSNSAKEEEILKLLNVMEEFRLSIAEEEKKLIEMKKEVEIEESSNDERMKEIERKLEETRKDRERHEKAIPPDVLKLYKRIQSAWKGLAVVPVSNGSCLGCHRHLPPQLYNILLKHKSIETCPFCNRFIYVEAENDRALNKAGG